MRTLCLACTLLGWGVMVAGCASDDSSSSTFGGGATAGGGGAPGGSGVSWVAPGSSAAPGGSPGIASGPASPPPGTCAVKTVNAYGLVPDMLIVLDRSLSMLQGLRWDPSKDAVKTITTDFEGLISFGLEYFPGGDATIDNIGGLLGAGDFGGLLGGALIGGGGGVVPTACGGMEKIDVPLKLKNAAPIAASIDATFPNGFTPTGPALTVALKALGDRAQQLDVVVKPAYVLLVTDGDPRCGVNDDPGQQEAARAAVKALKAASIPVYVFGYQIDPAYRGLMNEFAMLGGTRQYFPVESSMQIVEAFRQITKDVINCTFSLDEVPPDPKRVRVQIDGASVPLNSADGWVIEGKNVTLQGGSCATLKDGKGHTLHAQIECTEVLL
jgi:uncharacterized protein YegL